MFHKLGRFVFTSFFSRRSSRGFWVGSRWFGFRCCERGLLSVFTMSIPIHPLFTNESCHLGCSVAQWWRCSAIPHMGYMAPEAGDFSHADENRAKRGMRQSGVDRAPLSRNYVSKATTSGGENGNDTNDTARPSDNIKSLHSPDGTWSVRQWRR